MPHQMIWFFVSIAFSFIAWDRRRSIYLAETPPLSTGRSVAAVAYPTQFPLHRISSHGSRRRVT